MGSAYDGSKCGEHIFLPGFMASPHSLIFIELLRISLLAETFLCHPFLVSDFSLFGSLLGSLSSFSSDGHLFWDLRLPF
jgi:hypothetical protein